MSKYFSRIHDFPDAYAPPPPPPSSPASTPVSPYSPGVWQKIIAAHPENFSFPFYATETYLFRQPPLFQIRQVGTHRVLAESPNLAEVLHFQEQYHEQFEQTDWHLAEITTPATLLEALAHDALRYPHTETGGGIFGYQEIIPSGNRIHFVELVWPQYLERSAGHISNNDDRDQAARLKIYREKDYNYYCEWHKHLGLPHPSGGDEQTLRKNFAERRPGYSLGEITLIPLINLPTGARYAEIRFFYLHPNYTGFRQCTNLQVTNLPAYMTNRNGTIIIDTHALSTTVASVQAHVQKSCDKSVSSPPPTLITSPEPVPNNSLLMPTPPPPSVSPHQPESPSQTYSPFWSFSLPTALHYPLQVSSSPVGPSQPPASPQNWERYLLFQQSFPRFSPSLSHHQFVLIAKTLNQYGPGWRFRRAVRRLINRQKALEQNVLFYKLMFFFLT